MTTEPKTRKESGSSSSGTKNPLPPSTDDEFPGRLKRLRLAAGLSQRELAVPGVSYAYISRLEAGTRFPSGRALRALAKRLGVSVDHLAWGKESDAVLRLNEALVLARFGDVSDWEFEVLATVLEAMRDRPVANLTELHDAIEDYQQAKTAAEACREALRAAVGQPLR